MNGLKRLVTCGSLFGGRQGSTYVCGANTAPQTLPVSMVEIHLCVRTPSRGDLLSALFAIGFMAGLLSNQTQVVREWFDPYIKGPVVR